MPSGDGEDRRMVRRREVSAGGVVYQRTPTGLEIVLAARRTRSGDLVWGLPKGRIDPGEVPPQTAVREVREETGLDAEIETSLGRISYHYVWEGVRVSKVVHFFLMRATGGDTDDHDHEMEDVRWFPVDDVLDSAAYDSEREVLARGIGLLK